MKESALNRLLGAGRLEILFQPIITLSDGSVHAAEALVRWESTHELQQPAQFLPQVAARFGLSRLTRWVLLRSLSAVSEWRRLNPRIAISVNVTLDDCASKEFYAFVASALARYRVSADALYLEVPEGERLAGNREAAYGLERLANLGVRIAIDDFGVGYASLQHLLDVPAHILKLDRLLIQRSARSPRAAAIVKKTIELAHALGLTVVAEGIENEEQRRFLLRERCAYGQGYHLGYPLGRRMFQQSYLKAEQRRRLAAS